MDVRGYKHASISRQRSYLGRTFDGGRRQNLRLPWCPPVRPTGLYSPVPTAFPWFIFCSGRWISHIYVSKAFTYLSNRELRRSDFVKSRCVALGSVKKNYRTRATNIICCQGKTTASLAGGEHQREIEMHNVDSAVRCNCGINPNKWPLSPEES